MLLSTSSENVKARRSTGWLLIGPALWSLWLIAFYGYCFRVRFALGHHPVSINDHAGLENSLHNEWVWQAIAPLLGFLVLWTVGLGVGFAAARHLRSWRTVASMFSGWVVAVIVGLLDPGGWFYWFCD